MNRLIVSITSYPERIKQLRNTLVSLTKQTYKDFDVVLTFTHDEYEKMKTEVNEMISKLGLSIIINLVDENTYCHKNTFEVMKLYPNNPILVLDDDVVRVHSCVGDFVEDYLKYNCIISRTFYYELRNEKIISTKGILFKPDIKFFTGVEVPHTGQHGILYPPNCFTNPAFYDVNLIKACSPTSTEMWIFYWCKRENIPICFKFRKTWIFATPSKTNLWQVNTLNKRNEFYEKTKNLVS